MLFVRVMLAVSIASISLPLFGMSAKVLKTSSLEAGDQALLNDLRCFFSAVELSDTQIVTGLLARYGKTLANSTMNSVPPLTIAAMKGDVTLVRILLGAGAAVDAQDPQGSTALMRAITKHHQAIVGFLLDAKANFNIKNKRGDSALSVATGQPEIVNLLLLAGARLS